MKAAAGLIIIIIGLWMIVFGWTHLQWFMLIFVGLIVALIGAYILSEQ